MNITGFVLAGGQSSRFGRPKMFEQYHNKLFYEYSVEAVRQNGLPVTIVTNKELSGHFHDVPVFIETDPHQGPLTAIYSAASAHPGSDWFVVLSADIPFITAHIIDQLIQSIERGYKAIVPVQEEKWQPLAALYHADCLHVMEKQIAAGKRSMKALLDQIPVKWLPFDADEPAFLNVNTQADWAVIQKKGNSDRK